LTHLRLGERRRRRADELDGNELAHGVVVWFIGLADIPGHGDRKTASPVSTMTAHGAYMLAPQTPHTVAHFRETADLRVPTSLVCPSWGGLPPPVEGFRIESVGSITTAIRHEVRIVHAYGVEVFPSLLIHPAAKAD
jgi:hypothetical protein